MQITLRFDPDFQQRAKQRLPLAVALLIAATAHAFLLIFLRIDLTSPRERDAVPVMDVTILEQQDKPEHEAVEVREPDVRLPEPLTLPAPVVADPPEQRQETGRAIELDDQTLPATDWQALAVQTARQVVVREAEREDHRADMWRRTHSVMFAPPADTLKADGPYLPDLVFDDRQFKGLGFKIGDNCFFGIPASPPENVDSDASDMSTTGVRKGGGLNLIQCSFE